MGDDGVSIANLFLQSAAKTPDKKAIVFEDETLTYEELAVKVGICVRNLQNIGVKEGSRIALFLPNGVEFAVLMLSFAYIGAAIVPLSPALPITAAVKSVKTAECETAIASSEYLSKNDFSPYFDGDAVFDAKSFFQGGGERPLSFCNADVKTPFIITMTSGSTGDPKPIVLTQENKIKRALDGARDIYGLGSEDVIIAASPMYHSLAQRLVLLPLMMGATSVIMRKFTPKSWLGEVQKHGVTFTLAVSSQLDMLLSEELESYDLSSLKCIVSSSALLRLESKEALVGRLGCEFHECYGASEIGIATNLSPKDGLSKLGSVGKALPYVDIRIAGGEIEVKTDTLFGGYYKQEAKTKEAMDGEYFKTGDLGRLDDDGFLYYLGRKKELIITGGINVYPRDVEGVLVGVEGVKEAAVIGVPDEYFGEAILAVVVADEGVTKRDLQRACAKNLADYQQPLAYEFVEALPKNEMGKLQKHKLNEMFAGYDASKEMRNLMAKRGDNG